MTKVCNRADRIHSRRMGALERIGNGNRDLSTVELRTATDVETLALLDRTRAEPKPTFTRKRLSDPNCSAARKALRSGKITR